jgi:outer membrane protein OmpA-like peptidoglycan-associated protein
LKLAVEGHTDSIGSEDYNQTLSEKRAESVQGYLVSSGVAPDHVTATGLGEADPVADNSTAAGRKLNRRVDLVVSGDVIGSQVSPGSTPSDTPATNQ